jgi:rhodanese-related sulfurtransferase
MPAIIDRAGVQRLMREGAQVVDVLPSEEFAEEHLPGAINIPLKELDEGSAARLRKDRPIVVYCHDLQ